MPEFTLNDLLGTPHTVIANVILDHYAELGMTDTQLAVFLQLAKYSQLKEKFPSPDQLADILHHPVAEVYQSLQELTEQGFISVTSYTKNKHHRDQYNLAPFFQRVGALKEQNSTVSTLQTQEAEQSKLYQEIEVEFGRTLSPIEIQTVDDWLERDHYQPELIRLALKEAVLSDARSLRYIDRILMDWQRRQIKTPADLQRYKDRFQ